MYTKDDLKHDLQTYRMAMNQHNFKLAKLHEDRILQAFDERQADLLVTKTSEPSCEKCKWYLQEDEFDKKIDCGICLQITDDDYLEENKIEKPINKQTSITFSSRSEDNQYAYGCLNVDKNFYCRYFEQL